MSSHSDKRKTLSGALNDIQAELGVQKASSEIPIPPDLFEKLPEKPTPEALAQFQKCHPFAWKTCFALVYGISEKDIESNDLGRMAKAARPKPKKRPSLKVPKGTIRREIVLGILEAEQEPTNSLTWKPPLPNPDPECADHKAWRLQCRLQWIRERLQTSGVDETQRENLTAEVDSLSAYWWSMERVRGRPRDTLIVLPLDLIHHEKYETACLASDLSDWYKKCRNEGASHEDAVNNTLDAFGVRKEDEPEAFEKDEDLDVSTRPLFFEPDEVISWLRHLNQYGWKRKDSMSAQIFARRYGKTPKQVTALLSKRRK